MRKLFLLFLFSFFALISYPQEVITEYSKETISVLNEELRQKLDGIRKLLKDWDAGAYEIRSGTFESDVATGTSPLTVTSTTKVSNLNVDTLDGYNTSTTAGASKIYVSDGSHHLPNGALATSIKAYGSSTSSSSGKELGTLKIAYGELSIAGDTTTTFTNLSFTSSSSYVVIVTMDNTEFGARNTPYSHQISGSSFSITNSNVGTHSYHWLAIGT